jgi:SHS2 domain-containing protein
LRDEEFRKKQHVSHAWEEELGLLHMRLEAPSVPALFVEAARAVAELMRGRPIETSAEWAEEVSIAAPDLEGLLVAWIGELVRRSVRAHVRFEDFDIVYISDSRLAASIRGVRLAQIRNPIKSTTYHDPSLVQRRGHVTAMPVLDV